MLVLAASVLALLTPLLRRRSLAPLARLELRGVPLVWLALLVQVVLSLVTVPEPAADALHLGTYVLAAAFVGLNRRVPGVPIVAAGAVLNGVTIALNGGTLPASRQAMERAGMDPAGGGFENSGIVADPVLPWLGDVFAWPAPLPLANVFSVGDVLIVLGVGYGAHRLSERAGNRAAGRAGPEARSGSADRVSPS